MTENKDRSTGRRDFLKGITVAGTASLIGKNAARAEIKSDRRLRVGVMGISKGSFISYSWSDIIEPTKPANNPQRGNFGTPFLNMDITHVWDVDFAAAEQFAARMEATAVKNYDGMAGIVDGIIFGGIFEVPWQHKLARPYLESKTPLYLSRPFAFSLKDIDETLELAAKYGTPILATAKHEHYNEAPALKSKLKNVGTINCVHATCYTRDYHMHLHTQFMLQRIFGYDVREVSLMTDGIEKNSYLQLTYLFNGWENQPPFPCALHAAPNQDSFTVTVIGNTGIEMVRMERSPEWRDSLLFRYAPQVIAMQRTFEGEMFEPLENIRKKTELFLTGYYSYQERGGAPVKVGDVPYDWHPPYPDPKFIDESMFEK